MSLLGKGGIALVWLAKVNSDRFGPELNGQNVALKQFPKSRGCPIDSSAITEIETGNLMQWLFFNYRCVCPEFGMHGSRSTAS